MKFSEQRATQKSDLSSKPALLTASRAFDVILLHNLIKTLLTVLWCVIAGENEDILCVVCLSL